MQNSEYDIDQDDNYDINQDDNNDDNNDNSHRNDINIDQNDHHKDIKKDIKDIFIKKINNIKKNSNSNEKKRRRKRNRNRKRNRKKKSGKRTKTLIIVFTVIFIIIFVAIVTYAVVRASGRSRLLGEWENVVPDLKPLHPEDFPAENDGQWQAGWVRYNDEIYSYNKDIMTFLLMGIDKRKEMIEVPEGTDGGQADALFLLVLNPHDRSMRVISINRNTMADIDMYNNEGDYTRTIKAQIAIQHGFGNGVEKSCEYQVDAVRRLFYHIPVHGYCAIDMEAMVTLTDLMGGVELTAMSDVPFIWSRKGEEVKKGEQILLTGTDAYSYVQYRDVSLAGSANERLLRQQQFLGLFIDKIKGTLKEDLSLSLKLYEAIAAKMITDVTADEVVYLTGQAGNYDFRIDQFRSLQGETVMGEQFEEFYVDEEDLYELIINTFYQPVDSVKRRSKS